MEEERQQQQQNLGEKEEPGREENEDSKAKQAREEWETMARLWLSAFPEARAVSTAEVETWIDSNLSSLPPDLQSMPRIDLIDRLLSIQNHMRLPTTAATTSTTIEQVGGETSLHQNPYYQFQRTEQWQPVYTWLESLATDEVVKSKDIADWLTANSEFRDQVLLRHSKYHLMHYIKKCHVKMLRRRERKKCPLQSSKPSSPKVHRHMEAKKAAMPLLLPTPSNLLKNIPKDSDLYVAKHNEAIQRYKILLELERKLSPHFSKRLA